MVLDAFIGKWQEESKDNFEPFAAAIGLAQEETKFYRDAKTVISYGTDGDVCIIDVGVPDVLSRQFRFKIGEPYMSANLDGTPMKSMIEEENGTLLEKHKMGETENEMEITRQIQGDPKKMLVTTKYMGQVMTSVYTKV